MSRQNDTPHAEMFKKSRENVDLRTLRAPGPQINPTGGHQICIFDVGRPVCEIQAHKLPYFLTGRVVMNLRWPKTHDKMIVQMLRCSKSHEKMLV